MGRVQVTLTDQINGNARHGCPLAPDLHDLNSDSHYRFTLTTMTTVQVSHRFVRYRFSPDAIPKIGLVDIDELNVVEVLGYADLFKLIEAHPNLAADYQFKTGEVSSLKAVEILAPFPGRDIL
jgi:hypothetical protein